MPVLKQRFVPAALVLLAAVALADTAIARADVVDEDIIPTTCGAGVLKTCGVRDTYSCRTIYIPIWTPAGFLPLLPVQICERTSQVTLYKDKSSSTGGWGCQVRRGDNGEELPFEEPVCEG